MKLMQAGVILSLGFGAAANAALVGINSITYTGTAGETFTDENNMVNGSGLSATLTEANIGTVTHAGAGAGNAWTTVAGGVGGDFFNSAPGTVVFDIVFDATYNVTDFYNWSYDFGGTNNNNTKDFTLDYGVGNFASSLGTVTVARPSAGGTAVNVATVFTADRVRITVTDNYFGEAGGAGGDRASFAEIAFRGTAVPEPSSAALLGLGGLALILRRRK